jgi:AhpD family alkylhydroperoxidase
VSSQPWPGTQKEKLAIVQAHIAECLFCQKAHDPKLNSYRVNDLCDRGRFLFAAWADNATFQSAEILDEETSRCVIEQETARARKASSN